MFEAAKAAARQRGHRRRLRPVPHRGADGQQTYILTSMLKRVDIAVYDFVKAFDDGKSKAGVKLRPQGRRCRLRHHRRLVDDIKDQIDDSRQKIIDGEIKVPTRSPASSTIT